MSEWEKIWADTLISARGERSQASFATFLGISSQQSYSRYERGHIPSGDELLKIALKLGMTVEEMLTGKSPSLPSPGVMREDAPVYGSWTRESTEDLEKRLASIAVAVGSALNPVAKNLLIQDLLAIASELRRRYGQTEEKS